MAVLVDRLRPRRRRPWRLFLGGAVATAGLVGLALPHDEAACGHAVASAGEVFGTEVRAGIEEGFLRSGAELAHRTWQGVSTSPDAPLTPWRGRAARSAGASHTGDVSAD